MPTVAPQAPQTEAARQATAREIDRRIPGERSSLPLFALIAGWLIPGAGHLLVRKPIRALLLFLAIGAMFAIGLGLDGKVYSFNTGDILDVLGFVGQAGAGILFAIARLAGWGTSTVLFTLSDYGTKFLVCAGLLNLIAAVDAHSLASGRKPL